MQNDQTLAAPAGKDLASQVSAALPLGSIGLPECLPDRRRHRRHDLECSGIRVERYEGPSKSGSPTIGRVLGELMDLSASGIRIRVRLPEMRVGNQVRIRLRLPQYAGISPFVASDGSGRGTNEWTGWMTVTRMEKVDSDLWDVAGRLVDMREIDRGMLGLYLSAHPLAA